MNRKLLFLSFFLVLVMLVTTTYAQQEEVPEGEPEAYTENSPNDEGEETFEVIPDDTLIEGEEIPEDSTLTEEPEQTKPPIVEVKDRSGNLILEKGAIKLTRGDQYAIIRDSDLRYANVVDGEAIPIKTLQIKERDEVHVAGASEAKLVLQAGEVFVNLSAKSHFEVSTISDNTVEIAFRAGEGKFNVKEDSKQSYIVRTHNAVIKGANVTVRIENGKTIIETDDKPVRVAAVSEPDNEIEILPFSGFSLNQNVLPASDQAENLETKGTKELVDEITDGAEGKKDGPRNVTATITFE